MNARLRTQSTQPCTNCGIPLDAQYFDSSRIVDLTSDPGAFEFGRTVVLASFELPPQYCGVLQYFFQFTDAFANDPSRLDTPDFEWAVRVNGHPLHPYLAFRHIVNPWGSSIGPLSLRLDDSCRLDFAVRRVGNAEPDLVRRIGARILGRYWYNAAYANDQ